MCVPLRKHLSRFESAMKWKVPPDKDPVLVLAAFTALVCERELDVAVCGLV